MVWLKKCRRRYRGDICDKTRVLFAHMNVVSVVLYWLNMRQAISLRNFAATMAVIDL